MNAPLLCMEASVRRFAVIVKLLGKSLNAWQVFRALGVAKWSALRASAV